MPCEYYTPEETARIAHTETISARKETNKVTRLLCETITMLEQFQNNADGYDGAPSSSMIEEIVESVKSIPGLERWWKDHKKRDRRRAEKEKKKNLEERIQLIKQMKTMKKEYNKLKNEVHRLESND